jgi:hypothetical protein
MAEDNNAEKTASGSDGWLERQLKKIVGGQENMQPIIKTCLSLVGFVGGFVMGYFIFGKEKDKKLHEQELVLIELRQRNREQEKEMKQMAKELEEAKALHLKTEHSNKESAEGKGKSIPDTGALNGVIPMRKAERTYLD